MSTRKKINQVDATEVRLYVAEDFREEANHKVSAIGLYVDNRVILQIPPNLPDPTPENSAALRSLCFLFNIFGASDGATVSIDVEGPGVNGVIVPNQVLSANAANLIIRMEPCIVTALGQRTFVVNVNQREFRFNYLIGRQEVAGQGVIDHPPLLKAATKVTPKKTGTKKKAAT